MNIGEWIKSLRTGKGFTREELTRRTKGRVSLSTIKRIESGQESNPTMETLRALQLALRVSPREMWLRPLSAEKELTLHELKTLLKGGTKKGPKTLALVSPSDLGNGLVKKGWVLYFSSEETPGEGDLVICLDDRGEPELREFHSEKNKALKKSKKVVLIEPRAPSKNS